MRTAVADQVVLTPDVESRLLADHIGRWAAGQIRTRGPGYAGAIEREAVALVVFDTLLGPMSRLSEMRRETLVAVARRAARAALIVELKRGEFRHFR